MLAACMHPGGGYRIGHRQRDGDGGSGRIVAAKGAEAKDNFPCARECVCVCVCVCGVCMCVFEIFEMWFIGVNQYGWLESGTALPPCMHIP